jgi:hypothetical protein
VRSLSVYLDESSTGEKLVAGLYADDGGHPGRLLAQGDPVAAKAGEWNAIDVPGTAVADGDRYWIALLGIGDGRLTFRDEAQGGCHSETSSSSSLDALPPTWTTGTEYDDCPVSAYAAAAMAT